MERSRDWMDQAEGDLRHAQLVDGALELDKAYIPARYPNAHPSGSPRTRYIEEEARRLLAHADKIVNFCKGLLSKI